MKRDSEAAQGLPNGQAQDSGSELVLTLNRREFVAAGSGLLLSTAVGRLPAMAADMKPEFTFALVSDNHLGRRGDRESSHLKLAVEEINKSNASFTLFCGDLVNQGSDPKHEQRYPEWLKLAAGLNKPYYAIPGNHDPDAMYTKYIRKDLEFAFEFERFRFVCFRDSRISSHLGFVTREQIEWIQKQIDKATEKKQQVVLVSHIIYHRNLHPDVGWWIRNGEREFGEMLKANQKSLCAFFAGHFHCGLRGWNDSFGIHEVVLPSTSWNRDRGLQKAPGYALDEFRIGYVLADVYNDRMVLKYKPLAETTRASRVLQLGR